MERFKPNRSDKNQEGRKQCVHSNRGKNVAEQRGIFLEHFQVSQNNHFRHSSDGKKKAFKYLWGESMVALIMFLRPCTLPDF